MARAPTLPRDFDHFCEAGRDRMGISWSGAGQGTCETFVSAFSITSSSSSWRNNCDQGKWYKAGHTDLGVFYRESPYFIYLYHIISDVSFISEKYILHIIHGFPSLDLLYRFVIELSFPVAVKIATNPPSPAGQGVHPWPTHCLKAINTD